MQDYKLDNECLKVGKYGLAIDPCNLHIILCTVIVLIIMLLKKFNTVYYVNVNVVSLSQTEPLCSLTEPLAIVNNYYAHVHFGSHYAQNYAGIIGQGLRWTALWKLLL